MMTRALWGCTTSKCLKEVVALGVGREEVGEVDVKSETLRKG